MPERNEHDEELEQTQAAAEPRSSLTAANEASIRACSSAFSSAVPPAAQASGSYDYAAAKAQEDAGVQPGLLPTPILPDMSEVPDGRYRVDGQDWIVTVASGVATLFERATPQTDPSTLQAVRAALP